MKRRAECLSEQPDANLAASTCVSRKWCDDFSFLYEEIAVLPCKRKFNSFLLVGEKSTRQKINVSEIFTTTKLGSSYKFGMYSSYVHSAPSTSFSIRLAEKYVLRVVVDPSVTNIGLYCFEDHLE